MSFFFPVVCLSFGISILFSSLHVLRITIYSGFLIALMFHVFVEGKKLNDEHRTSSRFHHLRHRRHRWSDKHYYIGNGERQHRCPTTLISEDYIRGNACMSSKLGQLSFRIPWVDSPFLNEGRLKTYKAGIAVHTCLSSSAIWDSGALGLTRRSSTKGGW